MSLPDDSRLVYNNVDGLLYVDFIPSTWLSLLLHPISLGDIYISPKEIHISPKLIGYIYIYTRTHMYIHTCPLKTMTICLLLSNLDAL